MESENRLLFYVPDYNAVAPRLREAYARLDVTEWSRWPGKANQGLARYATDADVTVGGPGLTEFEAWLMTSEILGLRVSGLQVWPWAPTPHVQELINRVPLDKNLVVSFTVADGVERAVWDNGCYYESYQYIDGEWRSDTIGDAESWPSDVEDVYGQACLYLAEVAQRARAS